MDHARFTAMLEKERDELIDRLADVAKENPEIPGDWEPRGSDLDIMAADKNETADRLENTYENRGILASHEARLREVEAALAAMEAGTYGSCLVCGGAIEEERLAANPAARTCKDHLDTELP